MHVCSRCVAILLPFVALQHYQCLHIDTHIHTQDGRTPLIGAVLMDQTVACEELIKAGADIHIKDDLVCTMCTICTVYLCADCAWYHMLLL